MLSRPGVFFPPFLRSETHAANAPSVFALRSHDGLRRHGVGSHQLGLLLEGLDFAVLVGARLGNTDRGTKNIHILVIGEFEEPSRVAFEPRSNIHIVDLAVPACCDRSREVVNLATDGVFVLSITTTNLDLAIWAGLAF